MFTSSFVPLLGLVAIVSATPAPAGILSLLVNNSQGFTVPVVTSSAGGRATCISGNVAVTASATNVQLDLVNPPDQFASTEIFVELFQPSAPTRRLGPNTVSGAFKINAKLCFPASSSPSSIDTVHILTHGINFDKLYWDIPGQSYLDAAANAGYATFSYDRLGTGDSDHPDPIQVVQSSLQVEILHRLIQSLRSGAVGGRAFKNVVGIGHSYGSIQSVGIANKYPKDLSAIILQGFTTSTASLEATVAAWNPTIAAQDSRVRFSTLPTGYQVVNNPIGDQTAFYRYPNFEKSLFRKLDAKKQTFSLGDIFTLTDPVARTNYTGPVDLVNGENDFIFCQSDCTFPVDLNAQTLNTLFPDASNRSTSYFAPGTGHGINAHFTAEETYKQMLDFVKANGL